MGLLNMSLYMALGIVKWCVSDLAFLRFSQLLRREIRKSVNHGYYQESGE